MKTTEDYYVNMYGYDLLVPKGTTTSHMTACGIDENYNFVKNTTDIKYKNDEGEYVNVGRLDGPYHDLYYRGINIPKDKVSE